MAVPHTTPFDLRGSLTISPPGGGASARAIVTGRAPDELVFELGIREDGTALERFVNRDRQLGSEPRPAVVFAVTDERENPVAAAV